MNSLPAVSLSNPPLVIVPSPAEPLKIRFAKLIEPCLRAVEQVKFRLISIKAALIKFVGQRLADIQEIFLRLIYKIPFNPRHPTFIEKIASFKKNQPSLERLMVLLNNEKFKSELSLQRDLVCLQKLKLDIKETLEALNFFTGFTQRRCPPLPIHHEMMRLKEEYTRLRDELSSYLTVQSPHICALFQKLCLTFIQPNIPVPELVRKDLYKDWKIVETHVVPYCLPKDLPKGFLKDMKVLENSCVAENHQSNTIDFEQPLDLRNKDNSCHLHSALQALLAVDEVRNNLSSEKLEKTVQHLEKEVQASGLDPEKLHKKKCELKEKQESLALKRELAKLIHAEKTDKSSLSYVDYMLALLHCPSTDKFRELLFRSGRGDFISKNSAEQLDAASTIEFLMTNILEYPLHMQLFFKSAAIPGRIFLGPVEEQYTFQVPLVADKSQLTDLIQHELSRMDIIQDKELEVAKSIVVDEVMAAPMEPAVQKQVCEKWQRIKSLPDVCAIHLKRFDLNEYGKTIKKENPVDLPGDEILTLPCDTPNGRTEQVPYEVQAMIVQTGSLSGGHYVAYVKRGDSYWLCDDGQSPGYSRITRAEFIQQKQAYVVILKKMKQYQVPSPMTAP